MRGNESQEWVNRRRRLPRIAGIDADRFRSPSEERGHMASEGGSKSADPSVEVPWREESSESDWKAEQADGRKTDAAVKEQLRVLTENFTLRFMDVKDSALLK